jgi:hypothetical protein
MRVFPDANILFCAAKADGAVRAWLRLLPDRGHACWADACGVAEARRNLVGQGPQAVQVLDALLDRMQMAPALARAVEAVELDWLPPKHRPVLAAAIRLGCEALVTGDRRHFGSACGAEGGRRDDPRAAFAGRDGSGLSAGAVRAGPNRLGAGAHSARAICPRACARDADGVAQGIAAAARRHDRARHHHQPLDGLADDFEVAFHALAQQTVSAVLSQGVALGHFADEGSRVADVFKQLR